MAGTVQVSMGRRKLETAVVTIILSAGCTQPVTVEAPLSLPELVTADNAGWTLEECLRRVTKCTLNGGIVFRPMRLGVMNAPVFGLWKETAQNGPGGPWVRIPFARITKVEVTPWSGNAGVALITVYGDFSFGHGEFAYGGISDPVSLHSDDGEVARKLKEALEILRFQFH